MTINEKKIQNFCLLLIFAFCALFACQKISDPDFWWHLKTGEWIWNHKAIPFHDPFSYTFKGSEWINYEWLFHTIIYPLYKMGGFNALILFVIICTILTFYIVYLTCRNVDEGNRWLSITLLLWAILAACGRFAIRPQVISFLCLALYFYVLTLHRMRRMKVTTAIYLLIPVQILWANIHGSFLLGIFLVAVFAFGQFFVLATKHYLDVKPLFYDSRLRELFAFALLLIMSSLVNPYTYRLFIIPIKTIISTEALSSIAEWIPVDVKFLGAAVVDYTIWFRSFFIIGVCSFIIKMRNLKRIENVVIFCVFSFMAFKHLRFAADFAIISCPIIASNLSQIRWHEMKTKILLCVLFIALIFFSAKHSFSLIREQRIGFGVWENYPIVTASFLKGRQLKGNLFNDYGFGGYLIWSLWPDLPVFIDGRAITIYDQDFLWLYTASLYKNEIWNQISARFDIDIVLLKDYREAGYNIFARRLDEDDNWILVAFDDVSSLYLRKNSKYKETIKRHGFRYLRPGDLSMGYAQQWKNNELYMRELEIELQYACSQFPTEFYPLYYYGLYNQICGTKERLKKARDYFLMAISRKPYFPHGHYELGVVHLRLNEYKEAIRCFKRALNLSINVSPDIYYNLGIAFYYDGNLKKAIKYLEKYKEMVGYSARPDAYRILGYSYLSKYKLTKALSCFLRLNYLEPNRWDTLLNLGSIYFGQNEFQNARDYFELARKIKPKSIKAIYNLAVTYDRLGQADQAHKYFRHLINLIPQSDDERKLIQKAIKRIGK